jgi:3'(2'), 5'-bisphosphate nucleotidase
LAIDEPESEGGSRVTVLGSLSADPGSLRSASDDVLAEGLAAEAGRLLLEVRDELGGGDSSLLRQEGDRRSHELLMRRLTAERPDDAVLSEEGKDDRSRLSADRVWIVDPLDGTREFSEPPRDDWAVHVALWERGVLVAGAVALPARDVVLGTAQPASPRPAHAGRLRVVVSRTRPPAVATAVAEALDAELVPMGSAGVKAVSVLLGDVDVYVHAGGQYEWDSAAPVAVCSAAGLHCSRIDGSPLRYNQEDVLLPDLLVSRPEHVAAALDAIARGA